MNQSQALFTKAQQYTPGGVNSPVRSFNGVGGTPFFVDHGRGAYLVDVDGNEYIDYIGSWGPLIAGHAHPHVLEKVANQLKKGTSYGIPTGLEVELAERVCGLMPAMEQVRFVSSGTEAGMSAIRLARGFTKRDKILKFIGCYHGHADSLLVAAGSGALTFGIPNSAGVPVELAQHTLLAHFNDLETVTALFERYGDEIACIILEPIAGNMNFITPQPGFLEGLRKLCDQYGSVLIFDEVMTGFRVAKGGAQEHFNIKPDLSIIAKVIGGGCPVGGFGGRADIMRSIAPLGPVYQAGTLSGNPIAMACGLATLDLLEAPGFYENLSNQTNALVTGLTAAAHQAGIPFFAKSIGGMFGFFFTDQADVRDEREVKQCDIERFKRFFHAMLREGVYFAPSAFEAGFVSSAHGAAEIEQTIQRAAKVFGSL